MSRENRINPGTYTQAGRLSPDDAAREYAKQHQPIQGRSGKAHPRSRAEAWMQQAQRPRDTAIAAPDATDGFRTAFLIATAAAVCLSLYCAVRLLRR